MGSLIQTSAAALLASRGCVSLGARPNRS